MADVFSAECLEGFCSQCAFEDCACLHHLESQEPDYDGDFDDDDEYYQDEFEEALMNCGMDRKGFCSKAGSEECDFECPFS